MSFFRVVPVLAAAATTFAACSPKPAPGTIMLAVSTNLVPGKDFQRGLVVVQADAGKGDKNPVQTQEFGTGDTLFPWTVALRAGESSDGETFTARVRVVLIRGGEQILGEGAAIAGRDLALTLPPPGEIQMVHVSIDWLSLVEPPFQQAAGLTGDVDFGGDAFPRLSPHGCSTTLDTRGECVPIVVDEQGPVDRKVEAYDPKLVFGGGETTDAPESTCFPAKACFAGGTEVTTRLQGDACIADVPAGANVAVLTTASAGVENDRCGAGCGDELAPGKFGAVLDSELLTAQGNQVTLPRAVCDRFPQGATLVVSNACPAKTRPVPLCSEDGDPPGRVVTTKRLR